MVTHRFQKWNTPKALKTFYNGMSSGYSQPGSNAFFSQWTKDNFKTSSFMASEGIRSMDSKSSKKRKNLQHYTFGGMTNIRNTTMLNDMTPNRFASSEFNQSNDGMMETGGEVLTGFGASQSNGKSSGYIPLNPPTRPKVPNFFDQAYGTDVRKRAKDRPQSCKSGYSRKSNVIERLRTYKPPNPYAQSGSYFYRSKNDKTGKNGVSTTQPVEDPRRFNEAVSVTSKQVSEGRRNRQGKKGQRSTRRIIRDDVKKTSTIDALQHELERRKQTEKTGQYRTIDRNEDVDAHGQYPENENLEGEDYHNDQVDADAQENRQTIDYDARSSVSYNLKRQIEEERNKRLELEKQIEDLKRFNQEISSQLGLKFGNK